MANSQRFLKLEERLQELRQHMLPENFSEIGEYTEKELDLARGYKLLAHAEIESFLEDIAKNKVLQVIREWETQRKPSLTLISFLASYHSSWNVDDNISNEEIIKLSKSRTKSESIKETIDIACKQFIKKIKENHGIREKNFLTLILPLGYDEKNIDATLVSNLDSFGKLRGDIAHNSRNSLTISINPQDELNAVNNILDGLRELDSEIEKIY